MAARREAGSCVYALLTLFALYYLLPLAVIVLNSFRDLGDIGRNGLIGFPRQLLARALVASAWNSYCVGGACAGIAPFFYNSLEMAIPATLISTALGAVNGYVLSKWRFRGSDALFRLHDARRVHAGPDGAAALGDHARA